jgi:hypothetical protein
LACGGGEDFGRAFLDVEFGEVGGLADGVEEVVVVFEEVFFGGDLGEEGLDVLEGFGIGLGLGRLVVGVSG